MALLDNENVLAEHIWNDKPHSEQVTLVLEELIKKTSFNISQLNAIICGQGPGSFTGIRVALSLSKSLSYSLNVPLITVDDCFSLALCSPKTNLSFVSLIDAQKNKLFCAIYSYQNDQWYVDIAPCLVSHTELNDLLKKKKYHCSGNGYSQLQNQSTGISLSKLEYLGSEYDFPLASTTAQHVINNWNRYSKNTWKEARALYLRKSSAEEVLEAKRK